MRLWTSILILVMLIAKLTGQNLVPNPSFEYSVQCPFGPGQISYAANWLNFGQTPDYFNACVPYVQGLQIYSVPYNYGYQLAASGQAYCGLTIYHYQGDAKEYIGTQLISSLVSGTKYFVSFKTCLCKSSGYGCNIASDKIGAKFSKTSFSMPNSPPSTNSAMVFANYIITDTTNWTTVKGSFTADSNYNYIMLGNFFDYLNTNTVVIDNQLPQFAFYYIDDICVSADSLSCNGVDAIKKINYYENFSLVPNPSNSFVKLTIINPNSKNYIFKLYDAFGNIKQLIHFDSSKSLTIDKQDLPSGIYFFQIISQVQTVKIGKLIFTD